VRDFVPIFEGGPSSSGRELVPRGTTLMPKISRKLNWALALFYASIGWCDAASLGIGSAPRALGNIGVVSLLGSTFHATRLGLTVFGNSDSSADVADWAIDQDTMEFLRSTLAANDYVVSTLDITPRRADDLYSQERPSRPDYDALVRLAKEQGFDTLIVVSRSGVSTNDRIQPGFGLYAQAAAVFPYASMFLAIRDVKTGRRIASEVGYASEDFLDKTIKWRDRLEDYSDAERHRILDGIEAHIHKELFRMLEGHRIIHSESKK